MARSTKRSLAGQAVSVARKVVSRRSGAASEEEPAKAASATRAAPKSATKKAPAKKTAAKKTPAKAAAKKAPAKKTSARKTAPAKKAGTTKTAGAAKAPATKKAAPKKAAPKKAAPAKAAAKKTAGSLVVKAGEGAWTKSELAEVLAELHEQREHSARIVAAQESELTGLMRDSGDGAGQDQADMGATSFERDHEITVLNNERDKLAQIDRALARIDDGTYGVCESCGQPIGKMRLMAFPRATLCMPCKQREERR